MNRKEKEISVEEQKANNTRKEKGFTFSPQNTTGGTINVKDGGKIPLFLDSWFFCAGPENDDTPPSYDGERFAPHTNSMNRFCINRHDQGVNGIFLDYSARKIWLKELWRLRWARNFSMTAMLPNWETEAPWMAHFKD